MFLTHNEYVAFLRGQAAGLIPADLPLPQNEKEIDNLIFHVGLMFSVRIAYRNHLCGTVCAHRKTDSGRQEQIHLHFERSFHL